MEANLTFSFTPLSSLTDCTTVTLLEDTVVEGVEFFGLQLEGNPDIVFPTPRAFINIIDNDSESQVMFELLEMMPVSLSSDVELLFDQLPYSAVEDSSAVVCVLFTSTPGQLITTNIGVTFAFTDGTASCAHSLLQIDNLINLIDMDAPVKVKLIGFSVRIVMPDLVEVDCLISCLQRPKACKTTYQSQPAGVSLLPPFLSV